MSDARFMSDEVRACSVIGWLSDGERVFDCPGSYGCSLPLEQIVPESVLLLSEVIVVGGRESRHDASRLTNSSVNAYMRMTCTVHYKSGMV